MKKTALAIVLACLAGSVLAQTTPAQTAPVPVPGGQVPSATPPVQSPAVGQPATGNKQDGIQGRDSAGTFEQRLPAPATTPAPAPPANRTKMPKTAAPRRDSLR